MPVIATFTKDQGRNMFDAVTFGDNLMLAQSLPKLQVRSMVTVLRGFFNPQTVTVELICRKLWVTVVARSGDAYSFNVGSRGKSSAPNLLF